MDPPAKWGLSDLTAEMLTLGTQKRSSTELAAYVDGLGATLAAYSGWNYSSLHIAGLSEEELKTELEDHGHSFKSRTDTEIIAHLIEEKMRDGLSLRDAVVETVKRLEGSYAIAVVSTKEPDKILTS
jgi:predicted Zn-dependent peptidase